MSCSSSARSTSRLASALLIVLLPVGTLAAGPSMPVHGGDIEQAWLRLAQNLEPYDPVQVRERVDELRRSAASLDVERLTPYALALVARARQLPPDQAGALLDQAMRLDPGAPEVWFADAANHAQRGALFVAASSLLKGTAALTRDGRLRKLLVPSLLLCGAATAGCVFVLWALLAIRQAFLRLWHDLTELASRWRLGASAPVLATVLAALPLFLGGDPVWLLLWLFALSWAYLSAGQKLAGALGLVLIAALPTGIEVGFRALTHPPNPILRAAAALEQRRAAPSMVDELSSLDDLFGDDADFWRLQGDCLRQSGQLDAAAWAFREGLRIAPGDANLSLDLGTVSYLQGDFNAALQAFQAARDGGADPVISNYNLSLTLAQTYHFRESDEAIAAARTAGESRLRSLTRDNDHQLLLAVFTSEDARALLARKSPVALLNRGLLPPPLTRARTVLHPLAIAAVVALVLALLHYAVRRHTSGFATACVKCGRPFCRRCKLSQESQSYCTQCVNIFLKKDMVAIEVQLAKRRQLSRYNFRLGLERRLVDFVLPGLGLALHGWPALGTILAIVSATSLGLALFWLPRMIAPALMSAQLGMLQAILASGYVLAFVVAQAIAWERR